MWDCPVCNETIDGNFDLCWNCGADRFGNEDRGFLHADQYPVIYCDQSVKRRERRRLSLLSLLGYVTMVSIALSALSQGIGVLIIYPLLLLAVPFMILLSILHFYGLLFGFISDWVRGNQESMSVRADSQFSWGRDGRQCGLKSKNQQSIDH